ncbi:hypothetical protein BDN70DRAFT_287068 [Pholiota conissans]|uniref:Uncharacterized protein n=1 Tax=Pholiota conissans TaxID=109636 RepID=A0A9P6CPP7_9AGAR|nr:hypothetical protein BDN70DRAFT_287068 [Pholiota conissans]
MLWVVIHTCSSGVVTCGRCPRSFVSYGPRSESPTAARPGRSFSPAPVVTFCSHLSSVVVCRPHWLATVVLSIRRRHLHLLLYREGSTEEGTEKDEEGRCGEQGTMPCSELPRSHPFVHKHAPRPHPLPRSCSSPPFLHRSCRPVALSLSWPEVVCPSISSPSVVVVGGQSRSYMLFVVRWCQPSSIITCHKAHILHWKGGVGGGWVLPEAPATSLR